MRRVFWWHTLQLHNFLSALNRKTRREIDVFDAIATAVQQVEQRCRNLEAAQLKIQSSQLDMAKIEELKTVQAQLEHLCRRVDEAAEAGKSAERRSAAFEELHSKMESQLSSGVVTTEQLNVVHAHIRKLSSQMAQAQKDVKTVLEWTAKLDSTSEGFKYGVESEPPPMVDPAGESKMGGRKIPSPGDKENEPRQEQIVAVRSSTFPQTGPNLSEQVSQLHHKVDEYQRLVLSGMENIRQHIDSSPLSEGLGSADSSGDVTAHGDSKYEAMYVAFENKFRGTREEIKDRQRIYIPKLNQAGIGSREMPVLDLGCGRGEWLELLRENAMAGWGVDVNSAMVSHCRELSLNVREGNLLDHLRSLPADTLGAVTAFHVVEHLAYPVLLSLFDETLRALKPDGMMILETPNPNNFLVATQNFYLDPTHRSPLPSALLVFLTEARGFSEVVAEELNPDPRQTQRQDDAADNPLHQYLYGPRDYAVIARKR